LRQLCQRCVGQQKRVLLITSRQQECPQVTGAGASNLLKLLRIPDLESAPVHLDEPPEPPPHLVIFDLQALVRDALQRPVMQQLSADKLVRQIAKGSAAFANFRELLEARAEGGKTRPVTSVVVMSQDAYPMTPAQFKLLCGLYFYGNECCTTFAQLEGSISAACAREA
ncbi:hypothetical protein KR018_005291, partial [Drosophila ironensis]